MNEFEIVEKVGISNNSYSEAVKNVLLNIKKQVFWFEIVEQRGRLTKDNKIEFQVVVKIGCG
jgi:flavin-binding protein dodecin